jgi:hypothetical protein
MGCRREPETMAGVNCGGGAPVSGERRGRAGDVRWRPWEVGVLLIWGGRGRRRESRGGRGSSAQERGRRQWGARARPETALYRQMGWRREARAS